MPKSSEIMIDLKELTEVLVKHCGVKTGNWRLVTRFGLAAFNIKGDFEGVSATRPTAVVPLLSIGIREDVAPEEMLVDASEVWKSKRGTAPKKDASAKKKVTKRKAKKKVAKRKAPRKGS